MSKFTPPRCNQSKELDEYARVSKKIYFARNDTEIYNLTGCLSKCDKYQYTAQPYTNLIEIEDRTPTWVNTLILEFGFSTGKNELREQVWHFIC